MKLERQGVDLAIEFLCQYRVDEPVSRQPGLAGKGRRHDQHAKMALARSRRAAMACMQMRFVDDVEAQRMEGLCQLGSDRRCHCHGRKSLGARARTGPRIVTPRSWFQGHGSKVMVPRSWSQGHGSQDHAPRIMDPGLWPNYNAGVLRATLRKAHLVQRAGSAHTERQ